MILASISRVLKSERVNSADLMCSIMLYIGQCLQSCIFYLILYMYMTGLKLPATWTPLQHHSRWTAMVTLVQGVFVDDL